MQLQIYFEPMCKPYVSHAYDKGQKDSSGHKFDEKLSNLVQCVVIHYGVKLFFTYKSANILM